MPKAMLVDTDLCLSCNACTVECKRNNKVPLGKAIVWTWIQQVEQGSFPNVKAHFVKHSCMHCTEASCMNVCPTGAISKPDGDHVVINQDWCIGCGYCTVACPFAIPHFGHSKGSAQKCRFCYGNREEDEPTACASACPFNAISFGERDDLIAQGRKRVAQLKGKGNINPYLYGERELGGLHNLFVLSDRPSVYGLPEEPRVATANVAGNWFSGILSGAAVLFLAFGSLFKRREEISREEASKGGAK